MIPSRIPAAFWAALLAPASAWAQTAPYPQSSQVSDATFDFSTHKRLAPGSDNWPITWADDDHQYTSWGDGGGFGGTNSDGRVSLGFARVEGTAASYQGYNVWGGKNAENPAQFGGKSYGIVSVGGALYAWVSPGSNTTSYDEARLYRSTNHAATWSAASWRFVKSQGIVMPTILNFGKDYAGARDTYVYHYFIKLQGTPTSLNVHKPGILYLVRCPKDQLFTQASYQWFAGLSGGQPTWSSDISTKQPVFQDPNGVGWCLSVSYNAGLKRYLLATEHTASMQGNLGLFDAPEPWGPWTTVKYVSGFGSGKIETSTFYWNFSNKWLSADGKSFVLVFSGINTNDSWNTVRGTFTTGTAANQPPLCSITSPSNGATFTAPASISIAASASDPDGTVSKVDFFANGTLLGTDTTSPYGITWSGVAAGSYTLTARATDNAGATTTSAGVSVTVSSGGTALITNVTVSTGKAYVVDALQVGKLCYIDRSYTFTTVPAAYQGHPYIRTANDDKGVTAANYLTFSLTADADLYVAYDDRVTTRPAWLDGSWTLVPDKLGTSDVARRLYRKAFAAGSVTLGGNAMSPMAGAGSNYNVVAVKASGAPPPNQAPTATLTKPLNGAHYATGSTIALEATASDADGTVAKVEFLANGSVLGSDTAAPYSFSWTNAAAGTYTLAARATDNAGAQATSASVTITVGSGPTDSDGDGMPDNWETQYGLNPQDPSDASADKDGDGFTNLQEYQGGSDPTSASSTPGLAVTIDFVSTGRPYSLSTAQAGALYYIDRSYTIGSLSTALAGGKLIRTANDDKYVTAQPHLKFTVNQPATVYVCYDKRGTQVPAWLNDGTWTLTADTFSVSDGGASPMRVYRKAVAAGQVALGGNLAIPAAGAASNYVVVVK